MAFDHCPADPADRAQVEAAVRLTTAWATGSARRRVATGSSSSGSPRVPPIATLRERVGCRARPARTSTATRSAGSPWASRGRRRWTRSSGQRRSCPPSGRATSWGSATPDGILDVIARGVDMFDCVLPTRMGRTGTALTSHGRLNLSNARFARDERPLDERCGCPACVRFTPCLPPPPHEPTRRSSPCACQSLHNLTFLLDLTAGARVAIEAGRLAHFTSSSTCWTPPTCMTFTTLSALPPA